eukprot:scaffold82776_cov45-Phaeocystis_antarctica.AAC.2
MPARAPAAQRAHLVRARVGVRVRVGIKGRRAHRLPRARALEPLPPHQAAADAGELLELARRLWRQPGRRRRGVHLVGGVQQQQCVGAQVDPRGRRRAARRRGAPLIAQVAGAADERRGGRHDL